MKLIIDIPDKDIPTKQDILQIGLHFMDGKVVECDYPFMELPKSHGRLIDADALKISDLAPEPWYSPLWGYNEYAIDDAPTIIEADKEGETDAS